MADQKIQQSGGPPEEVMGLLAKDRGFVPFCFEDQSTPSC